jgi:hypothetical protein
MCVAVLVVSTLVASACGDDGGSGVALPQEITDLLAAQEQPEQHYVGLIDGTDAYVALVAQGGTLTAYICDGADLVVWFGGSAGGSSLEGTSPGGDTITATVSGPSAMGSATIAGTTYAFTAELAVAPAGLWELVDGPVDDLSNFLHGGWIVLPDGSQRGALLRSGVVSTATAVDTSTGTSGGESVVPPPGGSTSPVPAATFRDLCKEIKARFDRATETVSTATDALVKGTALTNAKNANKKWKADKCQDAFGSIATAVF